jgi:hypothetical protein
LKKKEGRMKATIILIFILLTFTVPIVKRLLTIRQMLLLCIGYGLEGRFPFYTHTMENIKYGEERL